MKSALFLLLLTATVALHATACYPDAEPDAEPPCSMHGATSSVGQCLWFQRTTDRFVSTFRDFPGVSVAAIDGFDVRLRPDSDGTSFFSEHWQRRVAGQTDCQRRIIWLASAHLHGLTHELVHAAEGCRCVGPECHADWDARGVYPAIFEAEAL